MCEFSLKKVTLTSLDRSPEHLDDVLRLVEGEWGVESLVQIQNSVNYWDRCIIAVYEGEVIGFAVLAIYDFIPELRRLFPLLANVYTVDKYRGYGVATMCIDAAVKEAESLGFRYIYLWFDSAKSALGDSYAKKQFKVMPDIFNYNGVALTLMKRELLGAIQ